MKKLIIFCLTLSSLSVTPGVTEESNQLPVDEIQNFVDIYNTIKKEYVDEKTSTTIMENAIQGMLAGLDPHSSYLKKSQLKNFNESTNGSYMGLGVQLEIRAGKLIIIAPIAGSPADKAGLKPRDIIVEINDTVIENMQMDKVTQLLANEVGKKVKLTIQREKEKPFEVELEKEKVNLSSVNSRLLENKYGYIQLTQFQQETAKQFEQALSELSTDSELSGLLIDLRNNPGGLVSAATSIVDNFLDAGLIVSIKNKNTGKEEKIHASEDIITSKIPLVILINEGSASASELLAGALQSHKRAIIVGQQSFGKGSVQSVIPLANGDAIKLTTARYFTPNGHSIQAKGITPDIILSQLNVAEKDMNLLSYGEQDISGHLASIKSDNLTSVTPASTDLAKKDFQLFEALNILKVINFKFK